MRQFAMLGKWHVHAPGYAREIGSLPGCRVSKVWDPDEEAARAWAQELSCRSASLEEILSDPEIEGVIVCEATNAHTPVILKACAAGKAVFTEKVLALTMPEAEEIRQAILKNGTRFAISFPHFSQPAVQFAFDTAKAGKLGEINYARVRNVHNGATGNWLPPHFYDPVACGGGAMIDLGAHPMYLLCELLGLPRQVRSSFTHVTGKPVEDNAVSVLEYENGALGVSETGFVSTRYPYIIEIGGTLGTLIVQGQEVSYCCEETGNEWRKVENLPEKLPSPLTCWALADKAEDIPARIGIDAAVRLTKVMEMAYAGK